VPTCAIIAGPNGAGKSTVAPQLVQGLLGISEFVNADTIASGLAGGAPDAVALQAGRLMLTRLHTLAESGQSFAFETTLSSRSFAPFIKKLQGKGYVVRLLFLWLPTPEQAIARVRLRTLAGGHDVPEQTIRRRHASGLDLFHSLYSDIVDGWYVYDARVRPPPARRQPRGGPGNRCQ
jgi:predicted ABC-type ATPase